MNSVVEKLAAIEKEVAAIQPKMEPLTERIAVLHQKVTYFTQQLTDLAAESVAVKQDVELTRQSLSRIQTLIGESKVESEQLVAGQEENLQRCETMTAVFGAAFQAVSQFFETAQRMGLADQAKAVFLAPSSTSVTSELPSSSSVSPLSTTLEAVAETVPMELPQADPSIESLSAIESTWSESDFDSVIPDASESDTVPCPVTSLPDVAAPPKMAHADPDSDTDSFADAEPSSEIASQLEVPPLNLAIPTLPDQNELTTMDETDEQEIEALLATMMTPVTATVGS